MTNAIAVPETNKEGLAAIDQAKAITISTNNDLLAADAFCVELKALEKEVDLAYDEHISTAHAAHKSLVGKKKKYAEPIIEARAIVKGKIVSYQDEQEKIRLAEEAKQREAARKAADEAALAAAVAAETIGDKEAAEAIIQAPVEVQAVVVPKSVPKTSTTIQTRWAGRVTNPNFVRDAITHAGKVLGKWGNDKDAVAAVELLRQAYVDAGFQVYDEVALNRQAVVSKNTGTVKLGGAEFYSKRV